MKLIGLLKYGQVFVVDEAHQLELLKQGMGALRFDPLIFNKPEDPTVPKHRGGAVRNCMNSMIATIEAASDEGIKSPPAKAAPPKPKRGPMRLLDEEVSCSSLHILERTTLSQLDVTLS